ncbi:MAG: hypothetical protein RBU30_10770 [Polyangia bacterium]|jgi:hypothetical protein|nr:hypothetical protein [Polyangia bacterium]
MTKLVGILSVGIGLALFAGPDQAQAQGHRIESFSRGVTMKCRAGTRDCTFHNVRPKGRHCTWSVSYVAVHPRRGPQHLTKSGTVVVHGGARTRQSFHFGRSDVRRLKGVSLLCRHRRHW